MFVYSPLLFEGYFNLYVMSKKKPIRQKKPTVIVTDQDVSNFITLKKRHADIGKKLDGYKSLFNEYAESTGFEEDSKVVIKRGEHEVTISETASMGISEDALNLIESDKKFKKYSSCLETVKVVNSELLMADLEKDLADGKITKEEVELLISTKKGTRITAK